MLGYSLQGYILTFFEFINPTTTKDGDYIDYLDLVVASILHHISGSNY